MNVHSDLMSINSETITLTDAGHIYEPIYLDANEDHSVSTSEHTTHFDNMTTDGPLSIIYEHEVPLSKEQEVFYVKQENVLNSNATEDESMAVEALRQLGNSAIFTKIPNNLPTLACSNCDSRFQTTADFQRHLTTCNIQNQLKCFVCDKMFERLTDLNNHLVAHSVERPHSCRICSTLFIHEKDFMEHLQTHGSVNTNQCKICGNIFQRPSSLANHMKIHTYQPGRALLNIVSDSDTKDVVSLPSLNLNTWDYDLVHGEDFNTDVNLDVGQEMTIDTTFEEEKTTVEDYEGMKDGLENYQEEIISTSSNVLKNENNRPHICKYCSKTFVREKALFSHYKIHSNVLQSYNQCKNCEEYLTDDESLVKHSESCKANNKLMQANVKLPNTIKINKEADPPIPQGNTEQIVPMNNSKLKFYKHVCLNCNKRFTTKQKLHRHMWIHRKKIFSCEICGRSFEEQKKLDLHRLSEHQKYSAYVCTSCGKCFSSRQGLWEHNRLHGDAAQLYKCTECLKTFSSRQGFLIHRRAHNDERPYGCRFCWKSFRDGGTLRKHERIHTGERPHACPLCTRAFNQKVVLREHVRWLHTANQELSKNDVYDCSLCDQKFTDKDDLCAHIVKHSDQLALLAKDASKNNINSKESDSSSKVKVENKQEAKVENKVVIEIISPVNLMNMNFVDIETATCECDLCGVRFENENDLSEHVRIHI